MKKFIIFLLVFIIAFIPLISFAAEIYIPTIPLNGHTYYVIVIKNGEPKLVTSEYEGEAAGNPVKHIVYTGESKIYGIINNNWSHENTIEGLSYKFDGQVVASNYDVKFSNGTVFFSPPKVSPLLSSAKQIQTSHLLGLILAGLIPILGLVILAISFRKVWGFLRNQLQH